MQRFSKWVYASLAALFSLIAQANVNPAYADYASEATDLLSHYIQINTTNPPGNEEQGAEFLSSVLEKNGIPAQIFPTAPGRACVYARLKGNGKKRAIILLNHIDVVPAKAADWKHDPFGGEIIDNEIWGRGAIDMKGFGIAELETLLMLKQSGKTLDRDIIFLATPDEEAGGAHGAEWFVENKASLVKDAEFMLNEGFAISTSPDGKPLFWGVDVSEKSALWLKVATKGEPGHASMPMPDSAPNRLVRALANILNSPPPPTIVPAVEQFFHDIAPSMAEPMRTYYRDIKAAVQDPKIYAELLADRQASSMLRDTVSLTMIRSGYKTNVIPADAGAELDCRLLPNTDKERFIADINSKIADPLVDVSVLEWDHAGASSSDTELFNTISNVAGKEQPGVPVVPMVVPWFTDSHWFRDLGITAYGFMPFELDHEHVATEHGKDERIPVKSFTDGIKYLYEIVGDLAGANNVAI